MRRPQLNALLIGGLLAALAAGIGLSHWIQGKNSAQSVGLVLQSPRALPDFVLETARGTAYTPESIRGRWQLLFFGFTHCPDVCPNTLALFREIKAVLPQATRAKLDLVFVSIDPARDSREVMRSYLDYFDPEFVGVTGTPAAISAFASSVGIASVKVGDAQDYVMDHSTALVLLNDAAQIKAYYSAPHLPSDLVDSLSQLIQP